jgi:hypothetical protein
MLTVIMQMMAAELQTPHLLQMLVAVCLWDWKLLSLRGLFSNTSGGGEGGHALGGGQVQGHVDKQALRKLKEKTKETYAISVASETLVAERESDLQSFCSSNAQLRVDNHAASRLFFAVQKRKIIAPQLSKEEKCSAAGRQSRRHQAVAFLN